MGRLTKQHARAIAKKLGTVRHKKKGRPHELHKVLVGRKVVALFGIRHGSRKDAGHGHLPGDLHLSPRETRLLADCPMSREEWIAKMKEKGIIAEE